MRRRRPSASTAGSARPSRWDVIRIRAWASITISGARRGIDLVRRPTGGRAVLHDQEVTYSIILPAALGRGAGVGEVYEVLSGALQVGLDQAVRGHSDDRAQPGEIRRPEHPNTRTPEHPNAASCFAAAAGGDGLVGARKLVGSAQARRGGAVLQHGSVLLAMPRSDWVGLFGMPGIEVALADLDAAPPGAGGVRAALRRGS